MHTPKRRSASPHIGRLRPLNPSARTPLQSLPPCARRAGILPSDRWQSPVWASEPIGQPHFPLWPDEPSQPNAISGSVAGWPNEPDRQISRRLPDEPDRRPRFVQANRIRHIGTIWAKRTQDTKQDDVTSPIARIRQRKPPHEPAVLWPNEPERPPHVRLGGNGRLGRTNPEAAARTKPVHSPSRLNPPTRLSVENSPVFFLLFTGKPIFALAAVVPALSLREDQSVAEPRSERTRGAKLTRQPGYFGRTNPRRQPSQHLAKRSQGAAGHACGQTNPRGTESRFRLNEPKLRTSPRLRQTNPTSNRAAVFPPNEPKVQPSAGLS
jgi:hypothetical protein